MNAIHQQILDYKNNMDSPAMFLLIKNKDGEVIGELSCLDCCNYRIPGIIESMTKWRQDNMKWFLTQFEATPERTRAWIEDVILPAPDRLMFLIWLGSLEDFVGHIGIMKITDNFGEIDNTLRGESRGPKGLMHYAEIALLSWMFGKMGMKTANLWLLSWNYRAIKWHLSTGFSFGNRDDPGYWEMVIDKATLLEKHPWIRDIYDWKVA